MNMVAFFGKEEIKTKYVDRVMAHQKADNLIRGQGWSNGKGCAVGCTLEAYDHAKYETELGIPEWLARVEDQLFEGMSKEKSRTWPEVFLKAITPGQDLERVKTPFLILVLKHSLKSLDELEFDAAQYPDVQKAVEGSRAAVIEMIRCHEAGDDLSAAWSAAESAESAWSAAWSAESAARSAWSAAWSAESAARSAWSAAWSAESAARSAARSAESAAWSAARSAESAAWSAARSAAFDYFADELIKLIKEQH